jgi:hypothetical protein
MSEVLSAGDTTTKSRKEQCLLTSSEGQRAG